MSLDLVRRSTKGSLLTAADYDGNLDKIENRLLADVDLRDFGAVGNGDTDNTTAIQAALNAGGSVYVPDGVFACGAVTVPAGNTIYGKGVIKAIATSTFNCGDDVSIYDIKIDSTDVSTKWGIYGNNCDRLNVVGVKLKNSRIYYRSNLESFRRDLRIVDCDIDCDFSEEDYENLQLDPISIYGIENVLIVGNKIKVLNTHRVFKISENPLALGPDYSANKIVISNNLIRGSTTSAKQVMDFFRNTGELIINGNQIFVTGFSSVIEDKSYVGQGDTNPNHRQVVVSDNIIHTDRSGVVLQGSYGLADTRPAEYVLSNNFIETTSTSINDVPISLRFLRTATITGNQLRRAAASNVPCIEVASCYTVVATGNSLDGGVFTITARTSNMSGVSFTSQPRSVVAVGNTLSNFGGTAGFRLVNIDSPDGVVNISGNNILVDVNVASSMRAYSVDNVNLDKLFVTNNIYSSEIDNAATPSYLNTNDIATTVDAGNSWN
jgi:hypothetical protein